jgi:hypothetical protein
LTLFYRQFDQQARHLKCQFDIARRLYSARKRSRADIVAGGDDHGFNGTYHLGRRRGWPPAAQTSQHSRDPEWYFFAMRPEMLIWFRSIHIASPAGWCGGRIKKGMILPRMRGL